MKNVIEIKNLSKKYKSGFELNDINIEIPSGFIIGLIGENGAGKTTIIKSLLGILKIDKGNIKIFNKDYNDENIKEDIGIVLDNSFFPELLTAADIGLSMKNIYNNFDSELYNKYLVDFNISKNSQIKTFSKGMRKKLEIITALSHKPKLLILDEPTSGLDPIVRNEILDLFLNFISDENHSILLSTHITTDLEKIADKIIFLDKGKIVMNENKDDIIDNYAILKCDIDSFNKIDKEDIIRFKKNKYNYEVLVKDKRKLKKKYNEFVIDNITLDDLMYLVVKGDKLC